MSNRHERQFNYECRRLEQNDLTLTKFEWTNQDDSYDHTPGVPFDDTHCIELGRVLSGNTSLTRLVFRLGPAVATEITPRGSDALAEGIRFCNLNSICITGEIRRNEQIQVILHVIRNSSTIQKLETSFSSFGFVALANFLNPPKNTIQPCSIVELCISSGLSTHGIAELSEILYNNYSIKTLEIDRIPMSDKAIATFIRLWRHDSPLSNLILKGNSISPRGVKMLIRATKERPFLQKLDLSYNSKIGCRGFCMIGKELGNISLVELNLSTCACFWEAKRASMKACRALADGLQRNQTIQNLSWYGNYIGYEGLQMILRATANRKVQLNPYIELWSNRELKTIGEELSNAQLGRLSLAWEHENETDGIERDAAYLALFKGLNENRTLRALSFNNFWFKTREVEMVLAAVGNHPTIKELNAAIVDEGLGTIGNQLATSTLIILKFTLFIAKECVNNGIGGLAQGLANNSFIQELYLSHSSVRFTDALQLMRAVTNHPSLQKVYFDFHQMILWFNEIKLIAEAVLPSIILKEFRVKASSTSYGTESILAKLAKTALMESIANNIYLHHFDFPDLGLNDHINFYLDLNRCGRLHLMANALALAPGLWTPLLGKLASKAGRMYYFLREQPWLISSGRNSS
jgi:hypothetical protein